MAKQTVEELEVLITANADKLKSEIQNTNSQLSLLSNQVNGVNKSIGTNLVGSIVKANIVTKILGATLRTVANITKTVVKNTFELGSQYTRLKTATEVVTSNMGLTTEQVKEMRDALQDANTYGIEAENVIKTLAMSGLVDMAGALKTIDARTGKTVQGVTALILTMKDLGATAGLDSAEAIDRLSKFVRRGEIAFADGIIEIGNINVEYQEYARQVGKSVMQLTQEERARVRLNIVMEEGRKSLGAYASTMQTSGKAVLSVGNVVKDIYGMLGSYLEPIFASITLSVFNFVSSVRTALISNAQTFQDWAVKVAGYVVAVVRVIGTYLTAIPVIGKYFEGLSKFSLQPIAVTMGAIEDSTKGISKGIDKATGSAKKLRKELAGFDEMTVLKGEEATEGVGVGAVGGVETGIGKIFDLEAMNEQIAEVNKIADEVQGEVQKKTEGIINIIRTAVIIIGALIGVVLVGKVIGAIGQIGSALKMLGGLSPKMLIIIAIIAVIAGLAYVIIKNWEPISAFFEGLWEDISNWFVTAWNNIKGVAESVADWFVEKYEGVKNWIAFKIFEVQYLFIFLGNAISNIWETIKNTIIEKFTIVKNWVGGAIGSINGFFGSIWNTVVNVFTNVGNFIWDKISWVVNKVGDKIEEMKNGMKKFFGGVVDSIKAPINWIIDNINNKLISPLRNFKIPGILPNGINIAKIQRLATGGIIESPTMAVIGEAGREAVLPLDRNTEWIDLLASKINSRGGGEPINIVVKIGDDKVGEKVIDYINEKGLRTGSTLLNI